MVCGEAILQNKAATVIGGFCSPWGAGWTQRSRHHISAERSIRVGGADLIERLERVDRFAVDKHLEMQVILVAYLDGDMPERAYLIIFFDLAALGQAAPAFKPAVASPSCVAVVYLNDRAQKLSS